MPPSINYNRDGRALEKFLEVLLWAGSRRLRQRITGAMKELRKRYRAALKDTAMQKAFDEPWKKQDSEMAAIIYWSHHSLLDMLILTGALDNRREIEKLRRELEELNRTIKHAIIP